jgi:hypothetical protein
MRTPHRKCTILHRVPAGGNLRNEHFTVTQSFPGSLDPLAFQEKLLNELIARVKAMARRSSPTPARWG